MSLARRTLVMGLVAIAGCVAMPAAAGAFGASGGTEVGNGTAPANGDLVTQTDAIPANATDGSFGVKPEEGGDPHAFDEITAALVEDFPPLQKVSKRNQARLSCVLLSFLPLAYKPENSPVTFEDLKLQVALLNVCLQLAQSIPVPAAAIDRAGTAGACGRADVGVTVRITHTRSGYTVSVVGKTGKVSRPRLQVSCGHQGHGLLVGVRPRKRGQTLPQAGVSSLAIAYRNPTKKSVGIRTTFKVN